MPYITALVDLGEIEYDGTASGGRTGQNRGKYGNPNTYKKSPNEQRVYIYDNNGKVIYDIDPKRVKAFKINVDPEMNEHFDPYKLNGDVPQIIKDFFGW